MIVALNVSPFIGHSKVSQNIARDMNRYHHGTFASRDQHCAVVEVGDREDNELYSNGQFASPSWEFADRFLERCSLFCMYCCAPHCFDEYFLMGIAVVNGRLHKAFWFPFPAKRQCSVFVAIVAQARGPWT